MNLKNIFIDMIKNHDKPTTFKVGEYDDETLAITDGFVLYLISKGEFMLDICKFNLLTSASIRQIIDTNIAKVKPGEMSEITILSDKRKLKEIKNSKTTVYIDEKYLKHFDKDAKFGISSPRSPVLVYELNKLVGLIMPVRYDNKNQGVTIQ